MTQHLPFGRHVVADGSSVTSAHLNDGAYLAEILASSSVRGGATVLFTHVEQFPEQGVTAFCVLAESHVSIHTYPEFYVALLDVFTCGDDADPERIVSEITRELGGSWEVRAIKRGSPYVMAPAPWDRPK